tara:strand:- start:147 stop:497 length:351 start_codon:yes stop_codon:yes gene_type:complete
MTFMSRGCSSGVERNLAKVEVESSNLFTRSMKKPPSGGFFHGWGEAVDELFQEAFIRRAAGTTRLPFDGLRSKTRRRPATSISSPASKRNFFFLILQVTFKLLSKLTANRKQEYDP